MDFTKLDNIEIDGIDLTDYPKFCDAYISYAEIDGRGCTDEELDIINEDYDFVYNEVMKHLY